MNFPFEIVHFDTGRKKRKELNFGEEFSKYTRLSGKHFYILQIKAID